MSAFNFFNTMQKAYDLRTKLFTTASGKITYTAKTGRSTDNFIVDAIIRVATTATYSLTVTVPDGTFYGQTLLVLFETEASSETVDVTTTTGDDATQMTAAGGYWYGMWMGSTIGWATISGSAT